MDLHQPLKSQYSYKYCIYLLTTKQANYESFFQKTQQHNAVHVLINLITISNTYGEQDLYLKPQNLTCLHFFQKILNCIFHFNKEITSDFEIQILFF